MEPGFGDRVLLQSLWALNKRSSCLSVLSTVIPTLCHPAQAMLQNFATPLLLWAGEVGLAGKDTCYRTVVSSLTPGGRRQALRSRPLISVHACYVCACRHAHRLEREHLVHSSPSKPPSASLLHRSRDFSMPGTKATLGLDLGSSSSLPSISFPRVASLGQLAVRVGLVIKWSRLLL